MLDLLLQPVTYEFIRRALLVVTVVALTSGLLSCWLIHVGWSLLGDAVSHAVLPGVVIAFILGIPFAVGALVAALLAVGLVQIVGERSTLKQDTSIGIVFTTLFAVGLVLISVTPAAGHVQEILFGNVLGITESAFWQVLLCAGVALMIIVLFHRAFTLWAFDPINALTLGFPVKLIRSAMLVTLALVVVAGVQAVGVILVVALLITPGATAYLLTTRMKRMLVLSPVIAWLSGVVGIYLSYYLDVSSGGTIVVVQSMAFALAYLFAPREGVVRTATTRKRTVDKQ